MRAFVFVNDHAAAYNRFLKGEIPAQFVYGITKLEKMGYEVKVSEGSFFKDLLSFLLFKPDIFFMPFIKRKTFFYYLLSKIFFFDTKFLGWLHLDIFLPPQGLLKRKIHASFLFLLTWYAKNIDSILFLSEKTMNEIIAKRMLNPKTCHFIPWGGDEEFYSQYQCIEHHGNIISTGREHRDLPTVLSSVKNTNIILDIYTNDTSLPEHYLNKDGDFKINKGTWPYGELLRKVSRSKCMIIPLKIEKVTYCVGLSSLIEAIALGRPVIATYNPYWFVDIEKEGIGIFIRSNKPAEWQAALTSLNNNSQLVEDMSARARAFYERKCRFSYTENMLEAVIATL